MYISPFLITNYSTFIHIDVSNAGSKNPSEMSVQEMAQLHSPVRSIAGDHSSLNAQAPSLAPPVQLPREGHMPHQELSDEPSFAAYRYAQQNPVVHPPQYHRYSYDSHPDSNVNTSSSNNNSNNNYNVYREKNLVDGFAPVPARGRGGVDVSSSDSMMMGGGGDYDPDYALINWQRKHGFPTRRGNTPIQGPGTYASNPNHIYNPPQHLECWIGYYYIYMFQTLILSFDVHNYSHLFIRRCSRVQSLCHVILPGDGWISHGPSGSQRGQLLEPQ